ncbi:MAG: hypothetical protein ACJ746_13500 [Bryobacteraceae bacterium]
MSAMPNYGQEDDDFAYEDEHIEMESDNQEHSDLAESEFDHRPLPIPAEVESPAAAVSHGHTPDPKPSIVNTLPHVRPQSSLSALPPVRSNSSTVFAVESRARRESAPQRPMPISTAERGTKKRAEPASKPPVAKTQQHAVRKRAVQGRGKKKVAQPVQKKVVTTKAKVAGKKAGPAKKRSAPAKKTVRKPVTKAKVTGTARKRTANKPIRKAKASGTVRTKRRRG